MIEIDGSQGEGGGQVLRSSLALSILTRQPVKIKHIRARRSKPGLRAQHLQAVQAAAAVSRANVEGAFFESQSIVFEPGEIRSGRYKFDIGTAGSTLLVLQTIFLPLSMAGSASTVIITGGTHVPWAPCFHYMDMHWLPLLRQVGFDAQLSLDQAGFYPQGGGRITATIRPAGELRPLRFCSRDELHAAGGLSAVANLDLSIADRQRRQALRRLEPLGWRPKIQTLRLPSRFKGTLLLLRAEFEPDSGQQADRAGAAENTAAGLRVPSRACYTALGELGKPAERVADDAVDELVAFLHTDAHIDHYLADQLLLPLALASGVSTFRTSRVTEHLITNATTVQTFLPVGIAIQGEVGQPGSVRITPKPTGNSQPRPIQ